MTQIYYQGIEGSYHYQASLEVKKNLDVKIDKIIGLESFERCWEKISEDSVLVLAIENSYAGSIYENLYKFLRLDAQIIGEHNLDIQHSLCSHEKNIHDITKVYSHFKALPQCYDYLKKHGIKNQVVYPDTAGAAKKVSETKEKGAAAICPVGAAEMYGLNILDESIQDQRGNTTRFLVITSKESKVGYQKNKGKVSILFEAKDIPASLYKCLGAFATNNVNLTKIESLPDIRNPFSYLFWLDFEGNLEDEGVKKSLEELEFFTSQITILGEY